MGIEIERKFLVKDDSWSSSVNESYSIKQGYLNSDKKRTVRVRIIGEKGFLTIKGITQNITRKEYEYEIPLSEAIEMLELCEKPIIEKTRHILPHNGNIWEIDVFELENKGLVLAEIELENEDQAIDKLSWMGKEVSDDPKYYNSSLISNPFSNWE